MFLYEMVIGYTPIEADTPNDAILAFYNKIKAGKINYPRSKKVSKKFKDLLKNLLTTPEKRFGVQDVRDHAWFKKFKWEELQNESMDGIPQPELCEEKKKQNELKRRLPPLFRSHSTEPLHE